MAYKISYKVVSEQGEQLKKIAKDMDNYINQLNQIIGKLGGDELLVNVRNDLQKFIRQLEEERTVLNLSGQVISEVVQSYSNVEKKTVQKVDRAKAHNRDFYKRPVVVASAGAVAAAGGGSAAAASSVVVNSGGQATVNVSSTVVNQSVINQSITNSFADSGQGIPDIGSVAPDGLGGISGLDSLNLDPGTVGTIAAAGAAVAAGGIAANAINEKKKKRLEK
ncbi:hypothetical protein [Butyrivibrio sp. AC2005]|uniref:hypothetical protein n=1 Tax=Butyrivibrio sp. AC2005 TaxID=1280672 RepID=UPI00041F1FEF|nr:hypothetical protein [Butyrivibrio sp. AC2005]